MRREEREAALLETAAAIIERDGVAALSFDALATEAGVAASLPYAYFARVDDVLIALFDRVIGGLDRAVAEVADADGPLEEVLAGGLDVWFDAARDHGRLVGALLDGAAVPGLAAAVRRRDAASQRLWESVLARHVAASEVDIAVLAGMLNATATATIGLWLRRRGSRAALTHAFVRLVLAAASGVVRTPSRRRPQPPG